MNQTFLQLHFSDVFHSYTVLIILLLLVLLCQTYTGNLIKFCYLFILVRLFRLSPPPFFFFCLTEYRRLICPRLLYRDF